jgi:hypothetical protein
MQSKVYSAAVVGVEAFEVEIEVHAGWGNTDRIAVVGLPDTAVKESKDRVTSAINRFESTYRRCHPKISVRSLRDLCKPSRSARVGKSENRRPCEDGGCDDWEIPDYDTN